MKENAPRNEAEDYKRRRERLQREIENGLTIEGIRERRDRQKANAIERIRKKIEEGDEETAHQVMGFLWVLSTSDDYDEQSLLWDVLEAFSRERRRTARENASDWFIAEYSPKTPAERATQNILRTLRESGIYLEPEEIAYIALTANTKQEVVETVRNLFF